MMNSRGEEQLAICESSRQVKWLLDQKTISNKITHWIAANPTSYWALKEYDVAFSTLDAFQRNNTPDWIESLQREQFDWAKNVDKFLNDRIPKFASVDFRPAEFYLFYLKNCWDTYIHRADVLEQIVIQMKPDTVLFFPNPKPVKYDTDLTIHASAFSECIPLWAAYHGIYSKFLNTQSGDLFWHPLVHAIQNRKGDLLKIKKMFDNYGQEKTIKHSSAHSPHIFVRKGYDCTDELIIRLRKKGCYIQSFDALLPRSVRVDTLESSIAPLLNESWEVVNEQKWFWQPQGGQDWSLQEILEPLFRHFWFNVIPRLWISMERSRYQIQKKKPAAICTALISGPEETGLIMAARNAEIPVIFYQHGASMGDIQNAIWDLTDCYYSDYLLVYGSGEEAYIRSRPSLKKPLVKPIAVGSTRLDRASNRIFDKNLQKIRNKILKNKTIPLVLYVAGAMAYFNNYFRYDYQDFRQFRFFQIRMEMARIFNMHPEVHFAYKTFESLGEDPTLKMLQKRCCNYEFIDTASIRKWHTTFTELLWAADLIIHEIPGTAMYESLVTDKPQIVYIDRDIYRMPESAKDKLKKRVLVAEDSNTFIRLVENYICSGDFSPLDHPNREYIKTFCTHLDDGLSAERAADAILSIVKKLPE